MVIFHIVMLVYQRVIHLQVEKTSPSEIKNDQQKYAELVTHGPSDQILFYPPGLSSKYHQNIVRNGSMYDIYANMTGVY